MPFLCWVAIKESRDRPRFSPDTRPFRYFGPARSHGAHSIFAGATADAIGLRVVHCFRYLAPASARIDPDTFRPYANPTIAPTASTVGGPPQNAPPPPESDGDDDDRRDECDGAGRPARGGSGLGQEPGLRRARLRGFAGGGDVEGAGEATRGPRGARRPGSLLPALLVLRVREHLPAVFGAGDGARPHRRRRAAGARNSAQILRNSAQFCAIL